MFRIEIWLIKKKTLFDRIFIPINFIKPRNDTLEESFKSFSINRFRFTSISSKMKKDF